MAGHKGRTLLLLLSLFHHGCVSSSPFSSESFNESNQLVGTSGARDQYVVHLPHEVHVSVETLRTNRRILVDRRCPERTPPSTTNDIVRPSLDGRGKPAQGGTGPEAESGKCVIPHQLRARKFQGTEKEERERSILEAAKVRGQPKDKEEVGEEREAVPWRNSSGK